MSLRELVPVAAALLGAIIGGLIAELRTWLQGTRERRQALSRLLYELLELRFWIARSDPELVLKALKRVLDSHVSPIAPSSFTQTSRILPAALTALKTSLGRTALTDYSSVVAAVAPFDPVLAFRLRGQDQLAELERHMHAFYDEILKTPAIASDPQVLSSRNIMESATVQALSTIVLKKLTKDCVQVARRISWRTVKQVHKAIAKQDHIDENELESMLSDLVDRIDSELKGTRDATRTVGAS